MQINLKIAEYDEFKMADCGHEFYIKFDDARISIHRSHTVAIMRALIQSMDAAELDALLYEKEEDQ